MDRQVGGGAPTAIKTKATVKTGAKVKIATKQTKVCDLGVEYVVQPAIAPPNLDLIGLEMCRGKAAVSFLDLRSKSRI